MSIYARIKGRGPSGFGYGSTAEEVTAGLDLSGRAYLVTGCNSGLGAETARVLTLRGATVVAAARTREKAERAARDWPGAAVPVACELSEPESVRACVAEIAGLDLRLDGIICNAGIMALPTREQSHGIELQFFTNHVGHFLLVTCLLDRLTERGRVVMVSSAAHNAAPREGIQLDNLSGERGYSPWRAYGQSKLANLLFARHLATRLPEGQTANAIHPGVIVTNLVRHMNPLIRFAWALGRPLFLKSIPQGAATQVYVATQPSLAGVSGEYFADCNVARSSRRGRDAGLAQALWERTESLLAGLDAPYAAAAC